jgi:hypothetical protein
VARKNPRIEKLLRKRERTDNNRAKELIRKVITPNAPLTKEVQKTLDFSSKEKDNTINFD